ncbi:diadenylate cyclase CdaA [Miniphocaeibacter massiliensis]|uniref:diadenylate cyclase CdaA n=1 Tax=Miniphocaeibacter massiliensis TaxID=2041841 RepID=UPI000C084592|nr:diadenylate cyclase CdaA [Miniphocaeibacter massiliensis]
MNDFFSELISTLSMIRIRDVIDILIVAIAIYKIYILIKETRAEQLMKGVLAIFFCSILSRALNLYTIAWILKQAMTAGFVLIIVVFQPELRKMLEYIGTSNIFRKSFVDLQYEAAKKNTDEIVHALASLSRQKIGALLVFERKTGLNEVIETGTLLDAKISSELLINIFIPNTPLHDGAVIIREDIIKAASCFLPLSENQSISKELGTRHRAALGMSEKSDSLSIVVSEETGDISIAERGELQRYIDEVTLESILMKFYSAKFVNNEEETDGKNKK